MKSATEYGWRGKRVRHAETGKVGIIRREVSDFMGLDLRIEVDGGGEALVRLNARGGDGGASGWSWYCENFSEGSAWLPLGDHNPSGFELATQKDAA
jgi:hypothetical protein